jgi:hypothetical protein
MIVVLAVAMAFEELGLANDRILIAFTIVFGALMLGRPWPSLGGRDLAREFLSEDSPVSA